MEKMNRFVFCPLLLSVFLLFSCNSNEKFEQIAQSFVQSNGVDTYVVFNSHKNHCVFFKNANDSLEVYDLKTQERKVIDATFSFGVKSLHLTSNERNGIILISGFNEEGYIPDMMVTLILPDEINDNDKYCNLCNGYDIRVYNDNVIECYNPESYSDFEYCLINEGRRAYSNEDFRYCGFLDNSGTNYVHGSLFKKDSLLIGSFYTDDPYTRVAVCGIVKSFDEIKLKSLDGNSEIDIESNYELSHLSATVKGSSVLPTQMNLFDIHNTGEWEVRHYNDAMGNKLPELYITKGTYGTFSNSATTGSKLRAQFIIDKRGMNIEMVEYDYDNAPPIQDHGTMKWIVQYGSQYDQFIFATYNDRNGTNYVQNKYFGNLLYILSMGTNLKFHAEDAGDSLFETHIDKYDFQIDASYFTNAWFNMILHSDTY